jgi:hypothetical protein
MHTVELLEQTLALARRVGYKIRQEWLGGIGGGACEFAGQHWIFVDLSLTAVEQLAQVSDALRGDPRIQTMALDPPIRRLLGIRKSA